MHECRSIALASLAVCLVAGCAHDSYEVIPNGGGSHAAMAQDTHECKVQAYNDANGGGFTGFMGWDAVAKDLTPAIESCMKTKGYAAKADNKP